MIITQLNGGLGNQLFQYAFSRKIAIQNKTSLIIDRTRFGRLGGAPIPEQINTSEIDLFSKIKWKLRNLKKWYFTLGKQGHYHIDTLRKYGLGNFNINAKELNWFEILKIRINKKLGLKIVIVDKESEQAFNQDNLHILNNSYLIGYWQSPKYFDDIKQVLQKELMVIKEPSNYNKDILKKILNTESVSLHVRRGDYVQHKVHNNNYGTCDLDYYNSSIKYIKSKTNNPSFYIFSDDPDWAEQNIDVGDSEKFVSRNDQFNDYEDLRLMYNCKHNITANSTFSWWGAYLNNNHNKIVLTPKSWFKNPNWSDKDLVPEEWTRI